MKSTERPSSVVIRQQKNKIIQENRMIEDFEAENPELSQKLRLEADVNASRYVDNMPVKHPDLAGKASIFYWHWFNIRVRERID
jgi:hypothetical protein